MINNYLTKLIITNTPNIKSKKFTHISVNFIKMRPNEFDLIEKNYYKKFELNRLISPS